MLNASGVRAIQAEGWKRKGQWHTCYEHVTGAVVRRGRGGLWVALDAAGTEVKGSPFVHLASARDKALGGTT